jgi:Fe2+ transport system protein FeoA
MITADCIPLNTTYTIVEVLNCDIKPKLTDMCCIPGTKIVKLFSAPFGDPIAYLINGDYVLSLRFSLIFIYFS